MEDDECLEDLGKPISSLKVAELRDELTRRSLVKTGNKKELVDRLRAAIQRSSQHSSPQKSSSELQQSDVSAVSDSHETINDSQPQDSIAAEQIHEPETVEPIATESTANDSYLKSHHDEVPKPNIETPDEVAGDFVMAPVQPSNIQDSSIVTHEEQSTLQKASSDSQNGGITGDANPTDAQATIIEDDVQKDTNEEDQTSHPVQQSQSNTITLKRGITDRSSSGPSNKEKRRKWSSKETLSAEPDISLTTDAGPKSLISGGISSQIIQKLIEDKPGTSSEQTKEPSDSVSKDDINESNQKLTDAQAAEALVDISKLEDTQTKENEPTNEVESSGKTDGAEDEAAVEEEIRDPTNVLLIENLVRPFTLTQLKEVLTQHGRIVEDKFWTDKVKSKCCAVYETVEAATLTKESLHGQQWPTSNPKTLKISYSTEENLVQYQASDLKKPDTEVPENGGSGTKQISERLGDKAGQDGLGDSIKKRIGERVDDDFGTKSSNIIRDGTDSQPELDDLYKKTKASPHLFWLPLNETEAEARKKLREEREARIKEMERKRRESPPRRRSPSPRRRSPPRRPSPFQSRRRSPIPPRRRSPIQARPRSPIQSRPRSPFQARRRSPVQARLRSPIPPRSRSPIRRRSPMLARRRSPFQRRSRSPIQQRSRSPMLARRRSPIPPRRRSPIQSRPRSPLLVRRRSPSPANRSPISRRSPPRHRTPVGRFRSPVGRYRSPVGRYRSPVGRRRSPIGSRSPVGRYRSPMSRRSPSGSRSPVTRRSPVLRRISPPLVRKQLR